MRRIAVLSGLLNGSRGDRDPALFPDAIFDLLAPEVQDLVATGTWTPNAKNPNNGRYVDSMGVIMSIDIEGIPIRETMWANAIYMGTYSADGKRLKSVVEAKADENLISKQLLPLKKAYAETVGKRRTAGSVSPMILAAGAVAAYLAFK